MDLLHTPKARRIARLASILAVTAGALLFTATSRSQDNPPKPQPQVQTFFLKNAASQNDLNDVQTALRNMLFRAHIYGLATENSITVSGTAEDLATAQKLIADLDRPKNMYRVTYTLTELDGARRLSTRSVSVLVSAYGKGTLKQGKKVPIVTATSGSSSNANTQFEYIDLGLNIEASAYGPVLRTKIEQSSVADEKPTADLQAPVIRQTILEGVSPLAAGKSEVLGTMDMPGSTLQQQISVRAELLPPQE